MLIGGLRLALGNPGPLLWTYAFNLGIAWLFSLRLHAQLASILDHSLAAGRLSSAFDLGTVLAVSHRLGDHAPSEGASLYLGLPVYLAIYFVLVPGALFCYQSKAPARLSILLSSGLSFFWRFVRITLLTLVISAVILVPLTMVWNTVSGQIDDKFVELTALAYKLPGLIVILLVACFLRLYFDLVEVYTVMLGDQFRPSGKADRRVHRTLLPAWRVLRQNFWRAYGSFVLLTLIGVVTVTTAQWLSMRTLAQPRVWPMFLLAQAGLFGMQLTRFWQRGAETVLACDNPLPAPALSPGMTDLLLSQTVRPLPFRRPSGEIRAHISDPVPDPEPAVPSLDHPDAGVFHHEAGREFEPGAEAEPE
jgi:hypothetical protein